MCQNVQDLRLSHHLLYYTRALTLTLDRIKSDRLTFKAEVLRGAGLSVLELVFQGDVLVTVLTEFCPTPTGYDVLLQFAPREIQLTVLAALKPLCAFVCLKAAPR